MKKYYLFLAVVIFFGCNQKVKIEAEQLKIKNDSLIELANQKDDAINEFIESLNEIEQNLQTIKEKESIISVNTNKEGLDKNIKDQITEDIQTIYELMQKNRNAVASINKRLKKANVKIFELEKLVERLTSQLEEKDLEIKKLSNKLIDMNIEIENLITYAENIKLESEEKSSIIDEKTNKLNTAFYVFGTEKELKKNNVITKEGGFIGLGKMEKLMENFNEEYFTQIDITQTNIIRIFSKKAKIITTHPASSYKLYGENKIDSLEIIDTGEFWKASKYLVIIVN
ncbi:MAG: hypothetical protein KAT68_08360 [Bacteroidales bacterium]|nr:hypothetical protein [Bacteroidales bacterium]